MARKGEGKESKFISKIEPHSEADPAALLLCLLVMVSNMIGRSAYWMAEQTRHALNLFVLLVGPTSGGRKGTAADQIRNLVVKIDPEWGNNCIKSGLSTGEGLIEAVRDPKGQDHGVADKRLLVIETEFSGPLKVMEREGNTLSTKLREAWDSGNIRTLTRNNPVAATGAHISILGNITQYELRRHLSETEMANGIGNRFLFCCARRSKELPHGGSLSDESLASVVARLQQAVEFGRTAGLIDLDPQARVLWGRVYGVLTRDGVGMLAAVTGRGAPLVRRIASIYAVLDRSATVRSEHLDAALAVWEYCRASAGFLFGDSLGDPVADTLFEALRRRPEGMTRDELRDVFGRHRTAAALDRALKLLQSQGLAYNESQPTSGRTATVWRALSAR